MSSDAYGLNLLTGLLTGFYFLFYLSLSQHHGSELISGHYVTCDLQKIDL